MKFSYGHVLVIKFTGGRGREAKETAVWETRGWRVCVCKRRSTCVVCQVLASQWGAMQCVACGVHERVKKTFGRGGGVLEEGVFSFLAPRPTRRSSHESFLRSRNDVTTDDDVDLPFARTTNEKNVWRLSTHRISVAACAFSRVRFLPPPLQGFLRFSQIP